MKTNYISKIFSGAIFTGIVMLALFGISASSVMAQSAASITVKKDVCNSIGAQNTCNGNNKSLQGKTVNFSVSPSGTNGSNIAVVIDGGGGSNGQTTVGGFVEGVTYTVCEIVPDGFTSLPRPESSTNGQQSASGNCIIVTAGPGNNILSFLNYISTVGPTAATAMVAGRVTTNNVGRIRGAVLVSILNTATLETQAVFTNKLGYYQFDNLQVGDTYVLTVRSKGFTFTPQTFTLSDDSALDLFGTAVERSGSKEDTRFGRVF